MSSDGVFRTDNMALAVVLALESYTYSIKKLTEKKAIWLFNEPEDDSDKFDDLINDFEEWTARVEPREFILRYTEMRRELMSALKSAPGTPAPANS